MGIQSGPCSQDNQQMPANSTLDESSRLRLAAEIMALFEQWKIGPSERIALLALPDSIKKRHLHKLGEDMPLPDDAEVMQRAEHIMGIADALRTYFPNSAHARNRWMVTTSKKFPHATPVEIMLRDGISGLIRIRAHLDCTYAWDISGSSG